MKTCQLDLVERDL